MKRIFAVCAILLSTVGAAFLTSASAAEPEPAFPVERMQRDWLYQDAGTLKVDGFFTSAESCAEEKKLSAPMRPLYRQSTTGWRTPGCQQPSSALSRIRIMPVLMN